MRKTPRILNPENYCPFHGTYASSSKEAWTDFSKQLSCQTFTRRHGGKISAESWLSPFRAILKKSATERPRVYTSESRFVNLPLDGMTGCRIHYGA